MKGKPEPPPPKAGDITEVVEGTATALRLGMTNEAERGRAAPLLDRILSAPRAGLARWPTPLQSVTRSGCPQVLVKRDDLSGWGRGGAKARKIEHLLGSMRAAGQDELITVAGNITNLAFDILPALDLARIRASLFILDDPPALPADREQIFRGIRDRVTLLGASRLTAARAVAARWTAARREGRRPLVVLPGVSHPSAIVGNACGYVEMVMQRLREGRAAPRMVFVSAATGATVAGFLLGERALREAGQPPARVVGVQVYPGALRRSVRWLLRWAERRLGISSGLPFGPIEILSSELHGGFGRYPPELGERCIRLEAEAGLRLDPIFGGKTWAAMERMLEEESPGDEEVLYWHCGYTPEWPQLARMTAQGGAA